MWRVIYTVPGTSISLFGYGLCIVIALYSSIWLAKKVCRWDGIAPDLIDEMAFWLILPGIVGGRLLYILQDPKPFLQEPMRIIKLWEGGLVLYGALIGGGLGLIAFTFIRKVPMLRLMDIAAPSVALGIAFGRIGCLMNGCCHGGACETPWAIQFPGGTPPHLQNIADGWQSTLGLVFEPNRAVIQAVEPGSSAERAGIKPGDHILTIDQDPVTANNLQDLLLFAAETLDKPHELTVETTSGSNRVTLAPTPSMKLHPTQLYSALDGFLICAFLVALFRLRWFPGHVTALLCMIYAISRPMVESLRSDDRPMFSGLSISQVISIGIFLVGLWIFSLGRMNAGRLNKSV